MLTHIPLQPAAAAKLRRCSLDLPNVMRERVDALARRAGTSLGCEVSHAAIIRAALVTWLSRVEDLSVHETIQEIRRAAPPVGTLLHRNMFALPPSLLLSLDHLWTGLGRNLFRNTIEGRSAVVLPALATFLDDAERQPGTAFEAIRTAIVKRGRKAIR
jgi:predicted DNA-binding protein